VYMNVRKGDGCEGKKRKQFFMSEHKQAFLFLLHEVHKKDKLKNRKFSRKIFAQ
jgi:hypothetical protein